MRNALAWLSPVLVACALVASCAALDDGALPGPKPLPNIDIDGGSDATPAARTCTPTSCNGHGTCDDASGLAVCTCDPGYAGPDCNPCTATTCSGHGTCAVSGGAVVCTCEAAYAGADCATCATGFQDNDGDKACAPACGATTCSGHGTCSDTTGAAACACEAAYAGPSCASCAVNFQDKDNDKVCKPACGVASCSGHGTCSDVSGTATCTCTGNFTGPACATCSAGFTGAACDTCVAGKFGPKCDYEIVYGLDIPTMANYDALGDVPYDVDNSAAGGAFTRVAYRLVLDAQEVWVEMNAFTADKTMLGVPVDAIFDSTVVNAVTVVSKAGNVASVAVPTNGTLEFWSHCYGTTGGNDAVHDYKDAILPAQPDCYGSMQLHIGTNTVFAYNRWSGGGNADLGFGNGPGTFPDWTGANNAASFATRRLEVFVK